MNKITLNSPIDDGVHDLIVIDNGEKIDFDGVVLILEHSDGGSGGNGGAGESGGGNDSGGERHDDAIPVDAVYANLNTLTLYSEMPDAPTDGDMYLYGDYAYRYDPSLNGWAVGLATADTGVSEYIPDYPLVDKNQSTYGDILVSINNKPITRMKAVFYNCTNLTTAPAIPSGVTNIEQLFNGCTSLTTAPVIPNSVTNMYGAFHGCTNLTGIVEINANPSNYGYCFDGVNMTNITLTGSSTMLNEIGATGNNYVAQ